MTRADEPPPTGVDHRIFGAPGAARTVIVVRTGATAMLDPDPPATAARAVRVVVIGLSDDDLADPATFGGGTPAETMTTTLARLVRSQAEDSQVGVVAVGATGVLALLLAAELGDHVDRLALVAVPAPETPIDRDDAELVISAGDREDPHHERPGCSGCRSRRCGMAPRTPPRLPGRDGAGILSPSR